MYRSHPVARLFVVALLAGFIWFLTPASDAVAAKGSITIWLMPNEPAADDGGRPYDRRPVGEIEREIKTFAESWGNDDPVTLLNVTVPSMREQLPALIRNFMTPFWPVAKGQQRVLKELRKFALAQDVHVNVRILDWSHAFEECRRALEHPDPGDQPTPDIVMIGSTWRQWFIENGHRQEPTAKQRGDVLWETARPHARGAKESSGTLPFILDVRLLFYWKRMPREAADAKPFLLDSSSWKRIIDSLDNDARKRPPAERRPPLVMPILVGTTNILHDYVPLVWAGGGDFLVDGGSRVDLTSREALRVPLLLSKNATRSDKRGRAYRLFAFPEASHFEATRLMIGGHYGGCIEPLQFLRKFYWEFQKTYRGLRFEDYVVLTLPPSTFVGGSDLMITQRDGRSDELTDAAFAAARFLAAGPYAEFLAEQGQMPIQLKDRNYGIGRFLASFDDSEKLGSELSNNYKKKVVSLIKAAIESSATTPGKSPIGREYPPSPHWPTVIESTETREKLQQVWRRISEGADEDRLKAAASEVELVVHNGIHGLPTPSFWDVLWPYWPWFVSFTALATAFVTTGWGRTVRQKQKALQGEKEALLQREGALQREKEAAENARAAAEAERDALAERNKALDAFRRIRSSGATAFAAYGAVHDILPSSTTAHISETPTDATRARVIRSVLAGWQRGSDDQNWEPAPLSDVISRSMLIAIDPTGELLTKWENGELNRSSTDFLRQEGLLRDEEAASANNAPLYFRVTGVDSKYINWPLMLEHALTPLVQNAIKHSASEHTGVYHAIDIRHANNILSIINEGPELSSELCQLINDSNDISTFVNSVNERLNGPVSGRPGLGLVGAFEICTECYNGISASQSPSSFHIHL